MDAHKLLAVFKDVIQGKECPIEIPSLQADEVSIDIDEIPLFDRSIVEKYREMFVHCWPTLQDITNQHMLSWLPLLFPNHMVPDDKKWAAYELLKQATYTSNPKEIEELLLTAAAEENPQTITMVNIELILRRAVIGLQCNLPVHAYSDVLLVQRISQEFMEKAKQSNVQVYFSLSQVEVRLLQLITLIMMNDCRAALDEVLPYFLGAVILVEGHIFCRQPEIVEFAFRLLETSQLGRELKSLCWGDEKNPHMTNHQIDKSLDEMLDQVNFAIANVALTFLGQHLRQSGLVADQSNTKESMLDVNLVSALFILNNADVGNQILSLCRPSMDCRPSIELNPLVVVLARYFYMLHIDLHVRHQHVLTDIQCSSRRGNIDKEKLEYFRDQEVYSTCKLPMEYRAEPGGDRDPNYVLRTLFALRREEMQNVRLAVDKEKSGFKLVAKRAIRTGETFLVEKPFASFNGHVVHPNRSTCAYCHEAIPGKGKSLKKRSPTHLSCPMCHEGYCSEKCKTDAYENYHKILCIGTETGANWAQFVDSLELAKTLSAMSSNFCLAMKLMITAQCQGVSTAFNMPEIKILHRVTDTNQPLEVNANSPPPMVDWPRGAKIRELLERFHHYCPTLLPHLSVLDVTLLHSILAMNVMGDREEDGNGGESLFHTKIHLVASFANHDCAPNAVYFAKNPFGPLVSHVPEGNSIKFVALRNIPMGEEITISYVDTGDNYEYRQCQLSATYLLDCKCSKCEKERKALGHVDNKSPDLGKNDVSRGKKK